MTQARTHNKANEVLTVAGASTHVANDANGNQTSIKDPLNRVTTFTYDSRGNQLTRKLPLNQQETFTYDDLGRQTLHISFEGVHTKSEYDAFGRLATKKFYTNATTYAAGTVTDTWTYKFDVFGREKSVAQSGSVVRSTTNSYDNLGRLASVVNSDTGTIAYEYDEYGRQKKVLSGADASTEYAYASGRLASVKDKNGKVTAYEYDAFGNLAKTVFANGCTTVYQYDLMNRLQSAVTKKAATPVSDFSYEYDWLGQKKLATEKFQLTTGLKTITTTWAYDNLNRVTEENIVHYDPTLSRNTEWQYDLVGNRTKQILGSTTTDYAYDNNDRMLTEKVGATVTVSYAYTGTQLTLKTVSGTPTTCTYNLQGRMSSSKIGIFATVTVYQYDEDGIRVLQGTTKYLNDKLNPTGHAQVFVETIGNNVARSYTIGLERISQYNSSPSATHYFLYDGHGNTRALMDATGAAVERYDYDAFGNAIGFSPANVLTQYLYCAEALNLQLEFYYLRARYYDPKVGRFNRLDPFFGNISDPQSLHKYTYCHGDPVNNVDPSGMFFTVMSYFGASYISSVMRGMTAAGTSTTALLATKLLGLKLLQYGLVVAGVCMDTYVVCLPFAYWSSHPNDASSADYTQRLKYILEINRLSVAVGDTYQQGGLRAIESLLRQENTVVNLTSDSNLSKFPSSNWDALSIHMTWAGSKYNCIGYGGVYVGENLQGGGDGLNWPMYPGISLSSAVFWNKDPFYTLAFYLHEAYHSVFPYFGHNHMKELLPGRPDGDASAYNDFTQCLDRIKCSTGESLTEFIKKESAKKFPPPVYRG